MATQSNTQSFRQDQVVGRCFILASKRSAPFRIGGRPMKVGHCGRNPAPLMSKMESTSYIPGGPNLMCYCDRPADFRRGSIAVPKQGSVQIMYIFYIRRAA